jgi:small-conductance mechanosensitive channel
LTPAIKVLTGKLIRIALIAIAIVIGLTSVGIDVSGLAVVGGALGLGIGLGLQRIVANLISGVILLMDKSIKPGDVLEVGDTYGWIQSLHARYVSIRTRDGTEHLVPNEMLITDRVINWSYTNSLVRLKLDIGVSYQSDLHRAIALCVEAAANTPRVLSNPSPACFISGFGDSSVDLSLRLWINDPDNGVSNVRGAVYIAVWDLFYEHGIEIPFPQRDLHIRSGPPTELFDAGPAVPRGRG